MKKIYTLLLVICLCTVMLTSLVGCGGNQNSGTTGGDNSTTEPTQETTKSTSSGNEDEPDFEFDFGDLLG